MYFSFSFADIRSISLDVQLFGYEIHLHPHTCPDCEPWLYPNTPQYGYFMLQQQLGDYGLERVEKGFACDKCADLIYEVREGENIIPMQSLKMLGQLHECDLAQAEPEED